jgi:ParB family chromosome partitioning protein
METAFPVTNVSVSLIDRSPTNPRKRFAERELQELAASIRKEGVVQPVILRPHPQTKGRLEMVAGERRWLASKLAGKDVIPGIVRELSDQQVWEIQIIENDQRVNLHPLEQARGFEFLMKSAPDVYTVEEIAERTGQEHRHVLRRLQLLKLIPDAQKLFSEDRLPIQHALELSRLQPEQQEEALHICFHDFRSAEAILSDRYRTVSVDVRRLREWIRNNCLLQLKTAPFDIRDAELLPAAGACTACPKRAANAPLLFADIAKGSTCTDPSCFAAKKAALVTIRIETLQAQGFSAVRISDEYHGGHTKSSEGLLYRLQYRITEKDSCEFTQPAVYVDGCQFGKQVFICAKGDDCPVHNGRSRYSTPEQKQQRRQELKKQKAEKAFRWGLLDAVRRKLPKVPRKEDLQMAAAIQYRWMGHDNRRRVFRAYHWEETKVKGRLGGNYVDYESLAGRHLAKMSASELQHFLIVCALSPDLGIPGYDLNETLSTDSSLARTAKRYKIDLKALRQKASASVPAAKKSR